MLLFMQLEEPGPYPLKNGKPTSEGIALYVEQNSEALIREFQDFVGDTLYNIWIYADELQDHSNSDSIELGSYFPHEIYISTSEMFEAYELDDLSERQRSRLKESNKFVKGVIIHELTHEYVYQVGVEMQSVHRLAINRSYQDGLVLVKSPEAFGSSFIEEGICEYITGKMGELVPPTRVKTPRSVGDLLDSRKAYMVKYKYASLFLENYLDSTGFKKGLQILLYNPPPSYEEILNPEQYFSRLEIPDLPENSLR